MRVLVRGIMAGLCALAACMAFLATGASAAITHELLAGPSEELSKGVPAEGPHGEKIATPGPFVELTAMTVDSGELYVAEGESPARVDQFDDSSGAFLSQLDQPFPLPFVQGVAVGHSTGEAQIYVAGDGFSEGLQGVVDVFNHTGTRLGVWSGQDTPSKEELHCFHCASSSNVIAVDSSSSLSDTAAGDVYVVDTGEEAPGIDVFKPKAGGGEEYVTRLEGTEPPKVRFSELHGVAVDPLNGEVLVVEGEKTVDIFKPAALAGQYEFVGTLSGPPPTDSFAGRIESVAINSGNGDIYIAQTAEMVEGEAQAVVDQFDMAGEFTGGLPGSFRGLLSMTVDPTSGDVFVGHQGRKAEDPSEISIFSPGQVIPDVSTGSPTTVTPTGATLNGTVNPDDAGEAKCQFEWGSSKEFGHVAACEPEAVAQGGSKVAVHATLSGVLQPDTAYYYRLRATNKNGTNPGEAWQDQEFTTAGAGMGAESVSEVAASSATLEATINPNRSATTYYFQYGPTAAYGSTIPADPGVSIGAGAKILEVNQHVQGLVAATTYHYRVVALSELTPGEVQPFYGADETFTTQTLGAPFKLPDSRQWQMVSPPDKRGALIKQTDLHAVPVEASVDGSALAYATSVPSIEAEPQGSSGPTILATRDGQGWTSHDISPPHEKVIGYNLEADEYSIFSSDLSRAIVQPKGTFTASMSAEASEQTAYLRTDFASGNSEDLCTKSCYRPLVTGVPGYADVPTGTVFGGDVKFGECTITCGPQAVGATPDLSHVVLESVAPLTDTYTKDGGLYEWSNGSLTLVSVLPDGKPESGSFGASTEFVKNAISEDGSRIVWSEQGLFMRDTATGETVELDAAQGGSGNGGGLFEGASSDGSRVFFLDNEKLTADSGVEKGYELYECEMVVEGGKLQCKLTDLTPSSDGEEPADVIGHVIGASEDGAYVYFVANGALAVGATRGACRTGVESTCNLYVRHDGTTKLIAVLSGEDYRDFSNNGNIAEVERIISRVSPNGQWLEFMSQRSLTGYDNRDAISGEPDQEAYLYDAAAHSGEGKIVCASCDPTGARPVGSHGLEPGNIVDYGGTWSNQWLAASVPSWEVYRIPDALEDDSVYQPRYLSDSGRLFFDSPDALVPQDVNGNWDAYEFEPVGVGDCTSASTTFSERTDGCVGLISSGTSSSESAFMEASESGSDAFFLTAEKLLPQDTDTALDIYDAHECTAMSPCLPNAVVQSPPCETGDSCKPAPSPQPTNFGAPASATFSGAGNLAAPPTTATKARVPSRAQKLAKALKACKTKPKKKRAMCERKARRKFAPATKAKKSHKGGK
jgi:hypothetical protein